MTEMPIALPDLLPGLTSSMPRDSSMIVGLPIHDMNARSKAPSNTLMGSRGVLPMRTS